MLLEALPRCWHDITGSTRYGTANTALPSSTMPTPSELLITVCRGKPLLYVHIMATEQCVRRLRSCTSKKQIAVKLLAVIFGGTSER